MLDITAGRMVISAGGISRFDSNDRLFHTITGGINGSRAMAAETALTARRNETTDYVIGSCHEACTHVIGSVKFTLNNYVAGLPFDRWHTVMGGSILWVMDGESGNQADIGINWSPPYQIVTYEFVVEAGMVKLRRRLCLRGMPAGVNFSVLGHTINWKLKAGLFT